MDWREFLKLLGWLTNRPTSEEHQKEVTMKTTTVTVHTMNRDDLDIALS
jgi:hypothetical protein